MLRLVLSQTLALIVPPLIIWHPDLACDPALQPSAVEVLKYLSLPLCLSVSSLSITMLLPAKGLLRLSRSHCIGIPSTEHTEYYTIWTTDWIVMWEVVLPYARVAITVSLLQPLL